MLHRHDNQALVTRASTTHDRWNARQTAEARLDLSIIGSAAVFRDLQHASESEITRQCQMHSHLIEFATLDEQRGIALRRYVIMPDHIHLFIRGGIDFVLTNGCEC